MKKKKKEEKKKEKRTERGKNIVEGRLAKDASPHPDWWCESSDFP